MGMIQKEPEHAAAPAEEAKPAPPCILVVFGANGDLTKRLLMPALYNLSGLKLLDDGFSVLGLDRDEGGDDDFRDRQKRTMRSFTVGAGGEFAEDSLNAGWWDWLEQRLHYVSEDFSQKPTFDALASRLKDGNAVFYLAVADRFFCGIIDKLHEAGLLTEKEGAFRRVVIEKPFGHDLASAQALNSQILSQLSERQIYRIDHFLGKETVQNIMALRFANGLFESIWSGDHIESVQITAAETVGVEGRGKFFEATGTLRDMVPSHMFQLLAMMAMEQPGSFDADAVRDEKARVIEAIHPMTADDVARNVVRGQYSALRPGKSEFQAYKDEPDVAADSDVETYIAIKLTLDAPRWAGVPFYLRTGKRMSKRTTEIAIRFKPAPLALFRDAPAAGLPPNVIVLHLQPHEGISLHFNAKEPGQTSHLDRVQMDFRYKDFFKLMPSTGYEKLIYDVLIGDPTLFNRADNIEAGWRGVQPILDAVASGGNVHLYEAGSDGPAAADALLQDGDRWRELT